MEYVVLVDEQDRETGVEEKMQAHKVGLLHRAISVFIFNSRGEMLLQQRAAGKYHSALLWTNTSCSHPRPNESPANAATRRLQEEMGMTCDLTEAFSFVYRAELDHDLIEHEFDHVFVGTCDDMPAPDSSEVASYRYITRQSLINEIAANPGHFTEWFKMCINDWDKFIFPMERKKQ
jgi:isopentenyl-diphosphate delta-isomerase